MTHCIVSGKQNQTPTSKQQQSIMQRRCTALSLVVALVLVTCCGYAEATHVMNGTNSSSQQSANDAASAMVDALAAAAAGDSVAPIPENHSHDRAQRIVARKGVSSDAAVVRNGSSSSYPTEDGVAAVAPPPPPAVLLKPTDTGNGTVRTATSSSSSSSSNGSSSVSSTTVAVVNNSSMSATSTSTRNHPAYGSSPMPHNASNASLPPSTGVTVSNVTVMTSSSPSRSTIAINTTTTTFNTSATSSTTSTASITTTKTTTTTTTTTIGTTVAPRKPKVVYSVEDEPRLVQAAKPGYTLPAPVPYDEPLDSSGRLRVDEPLVQLSKEYIAPGTGPGQNRRDYVLPIVTLIFVVPLLLGLFLLSYRRAKEFWLTRHYRRMDFLIDGMYNY